MPALPPGIRAFVCGCAGPVLSEEERAFFASERPFGLILFARNIVSPAQVRAIVADFRRALGWPRAPVFIDQEGGRVQRLRPPHWRDYPPAAVFGALFARDPLAALRATRAVHRLLGRDLARLGINADCLPVLDVPVPGSHGIIGDRAFSRDPSAVALLARMAIAGLRDSAVAPVVKHVPGHGRARADSHEELPIVEAALRELRAHDFLPFAALADAPMAMTAHVVFTALDAARPATVSKVVISEVIRGEIGFDGLLMSDDLNMRALRGSLGERAGAALDAGCDVVLHCSGDMAEMREVAAACPPLSGHALRRADAALTAPVAHCSRADAADDADDTDVDDAEAMEWLRRLTAVS